MTAPERIWVRASMNMEDEPLPYGEWHVEYSPRWLPYILATPEDLAEAPEVRALIDAAVKAERERYIGLMRKAHAVMVECGWHLAPASDVSGDGVLELAAAEIEEEFAAAIRKGEAP